MAGIGTDNLRAPRGTTPAFPPAATGRPFDNPLDVDEMTIIRAIQGREKLAGLMLDDPRYSDLFDFLDRWITAAHDYPVSPLVERARRIAGFYAGGGHGRRRRRHA
jgi:hypothetical protein